MILIDMKENAENRIRKLESNTAINERSTIEELQKRVDQFQRTQDKKHSFIDEIEEFIQICSLKNPDDYPKSRENTLYQGSHCKISIGFNIWITNSKPAKAPSYLMVQSSFGKIYIHYFDMKKYMNMESQDLMREMMEKEVLRYSKILRNSWMRSLSKTK